MIEEVAPSPDIARGFKGHMWEQLYLPGLLKGRLLFSPSITGPLAVKNQVVVIHDVVPLQHPEWINKYFAKWYQQLLPRLGKQVKHIIAISDFTKQTILEHIDIPESKISVVYNGVNHDFLTGESAPLSIPFNRYVLSLGSLEPRKNLPLLLKAWKNILHKIPEDVGLVVVGKKGSPLVFSSNNIDEIPERVYFTGHVSDEHIPWLYTNAMFFAYLSFYEGFGLPPLEAMATGCPVLAGNKTAIPEVISDAGLLVDPYSLAEIEAGMLKYFEDDEARKKMGEKGKERAKFFNWKKTSAQTWDIIDQFRN
ncbi:glycosyltransferase family 4 protein [Mucilaginibacter terrenus]|nr:glycosyltransferase family 1 protein [Mucilaginibacter terrenus]